MYQLAISLQGESRPLHGHDVTPRGIHGLLYSVLKSYDPAAATWLHEHYAPKPYSLAAYYGEDGVLAGVRVSALTGESAEILHNAWQHARGATWYLGKHPLTVRDVIAVPRPSFIELTELPPLPTLTLDFLAPTSFKQGPIQLTLPVPRNVFMTPLRAWNCYAPEPLAIDEDWLDWCANHVYVAAHEIQTVSVTLSRQQPPFVGFVGRATFAVSDVGRFRREAIKLHALAALGEVCGIGRKTTMGMGAVALHAA